MTSPSLLDIDLAYIALGVALLSLAVSVINSYRESRRHLGQTRTRLRRVAGLRRVALEWRKNDAGVPNVLVTSIRNGPYRPAVVENVTLETGLLRRCEFRPELLSLPSEPLEPDQPWTTSFTAGVLRRQFSKVTQDDGPWRFRVIVHVAGRRARSKRTALEAG